MYVTTMGLHDPACFINPSGVPRHVTRNPLHVFRQLHLNHLSRDTPHLALHQRHHLRDIFLKNESLSVSYQGCNNTYPFPMNPSPISPSQSVSARKVFKDYALRVCLAALQTRDATATRVMPAARCLSKPVYFHCEVPWCCERRSHLTESTSRSIERRTPCHP